MRGKFLTTLMAVVTATLFLLTACGGGPSCGEGTVEQDGKCVPICQDGQYWDGSECKPVPECAEGTTFNSATGKCEPDENACSPGTAFNPDTGKCEPACAADEYWDGTQCKPVPECAKGTVFNPDTGRCEPGQEACAPGTVFNPDTGVCEPACSTDEYWDGTQCVPVPECAPGTHFEGDKCVPDVVCGGGTHAECTAEGDTFNPNTQSCEPSGSAPECIPDYLPDPDVPEDEQATPVFDLPVEGSDNAISMGGVIGTPADIDGDGIADADWDTFAFEATTGGVYLKIWATSEDAAQPAFAVMGVTPESINLPFDQWEIFYNRYSMNPTGVDCEREFYLPRDGIYLIQVTDVSNFEQALFGSAGLPVGGDEFTYYMTLEVLPAPNPATLDVPATDSGTFGDAGHLGFYTIDIAPARAVAGDIVSIVSAGTPDPNTTSEVFPALLSFGPAGDWLTEAVSYSLDEDASLLFLAEEGQYMIVNDFLLAIGSNRQFRIDTSANTATDCASADCSSFDLGDDESKYFTFDLEANEIFFHSVADPNNTATLDVTVFDTVGNVLGSSTAYYDSYYSVYVPSAILFFAPDAMKVFASVQEQNGAAVTGINQTVIHIPELLLSPGVNTGITLTDFPEYTYWDAGVAQFTAQAGQLAVFTNYSYSVAPEQPIPLLMDTGTNALNAIDSGGNLTDPPVMLAPADGRYLHWLFDYDPDDYSTFDGGATYDVTFGLLDVAPSVGTPADGNPVSATTGTLDANVLATAFYFTAEESARYQVVVTPPADAGIVTEVKVFAKAALDENDELVATPEGMRLLELASVTAAAANDPADTGLFKSPYAGDLLVLVRDTSGSATGSETFTAVISYTEPLQGDTCENAIPVTLDTNGEAHISTSSVGASDTIYLPWGNGCTGSSTGGIDLFYSIDLAAGQTLTATVTPVNGNNVDSVLYIITDCSDPEGSCVAAADDTYDGEAETITYSAQADGTYILAVDSWTYGSEEGDLLIDIVVTGP